MSSPSPPPERQHVFAVTLTVYSTPKQSKGGNTTKQEKSLKTKELFFTLKESNYVEFLLGILEKHGKTQYKVTNKQCFPFKFIMPKTKGYSTPGMLWVLPKVLCKFSSAPQWCLAYYLWQHLQHPQRVPQFLSVPCSIHLSVSFVYPDVSASS